MNDSKDPLLREVAPQLTAILQRLLDAVGETDLASQIDGLSIAELDEHEQGSDYYIVPKPSGPWGPGHRTLSLLPGALHVDILANRIVCVEVLRGPLNFSADI